MQALTRVVAGFVLVTLCVAVSTTLAADRCRTFEAETQRYFETFARTREKAGLACTSNADCMLSALGPCNRTDLVSKAKLSKNALSDLIAKTKGYQKRFEECPRADCDKTAAAPTGVACIAGTCERTYE